LAAVAGGLADQGDQVEGEVVGTGHTGLLAQAEVEAGWAVEADLGEGVDIGFADGAAGQVGLDACCKHLEFVLAGCDIAIDPVFSDKIVFVAIEADIGDSGGVLGCEGRGCEGAVAGDDLVDNLDIVLLLEYKLVYL